MYFVVPGQYFNGFYSICYSYSSLSLSLSLSLSVGQTNLVLLVVYQINSQFSALQSFHIFTRKKVESKHDLCRSATPKQARLIFLGVRVSSRCPSAQTRLLTALPTSLSLRSVFVTPVSLKLHGLRLTFFLFLLLTKIRFAFVIGVIRGKVREGLINFVFFIIFGLFGPFNCVTIRKKQVWEIFK